MSARHADSAKEGSAVPEAGCLGVLPEEVRRAEVAVEGIGLIVVSFSTEVLTT
jgi:hypothetical protein